MAENLSGKIALVTGASRGIGRATALALAESGCDVAINYLHSSDEAAAVAESIAIFGRRAILVRADVTREDEVLRLVQDVEARLGPIDLLVNNAGVNPVTSLESITLSEWNEVLTTNLTSSFLVSQAVIPGMRARKWGRLIMLSSVAAQTGGVIGPHYAASKAGILGLMHSYANLLAKEGITANAIAPALIETDMIWNNDKIKSTLIPIGRFGQPEEVAQAVVMLASNGYITGQTLNLNGGWYMS
ncbi:SDR family NAD(P)-dependent oxidoreductase [Granulicella arctica]|uniref:SDR family NAD(P)-dependent oxidoreductase n=1 Tax=Granulicella arctica TaxID=940613 RepID=UPI0021DF9B7F|nr:3-oxoacyl-ACP reductase family protein [Granulicella arctica]